MKYGGLDASELVRVQKLESENSRLKRMHAELALAIEVDTSLPTTRVVRVLEQLEAWRGLPKAIRLGNGPELIESYNEERPHDALGNLPPALYRGRLLATMDSTFEMSA